MKAVANHLLQWPRGQLDFCAGCRVMGVLNVTPDSFSDAGQFLDVDRAIAHGLQMVADGAAIIDVGGESTRPGSDPVSTAEQMRRVVPVIEGLARQADVPISIDTCDVDVAQAALAAGAAIVNDITALADERMASLVAESEVPVVLMHMQGAPSTMQSEPQYDDVVGEVLHFLLERAKRAEARGVPSERIFIDPGIGVCKTLPHNLSLLKYIDRFVATGYHVLVGTSRKRFIGTVTGRDEPQSRVFGTAATVTLCAAAGVSIVRVHDVGAMRDVVCVTAAVQQA